MHPITYGLLAPRPVKWLIETEPEVKRRVQAFLMDCGEPNVEVVGPAPMADVLDAISYRTRLELPVVMLALRKTKHHLTDEPALEVKCSDRDLDLIVAWQQQARAKLARAH